MLRAALDAGVTLIDTADVVLPRRARHRPQRAAHRRGAQRLARRPLACHRRDQGRRGPTRRALGAPMAVPAHLRAACERSLRALGVERIDLYQLHAPDTRGAVRRERRRAGRAAARGQGALGRPLQRLGRADRAGARRSCRSPRYRTGSIRSSGSRWTAESFGIARSRGSGFWPTVPPAAAGSTSSSRRTRCVAADGRPPRRLGPRRGAGLGAGAVARRDRDSQRAHASRMRSTASGPPSWSFPRAISRRSTGRSSRRA